MLVKIASNRTIKKVYINLEVSNINVIDESLINFTDIFYDCCKLYKMRHVVLSPYLEIIIHKFKIIKIDIALQTHSTAKIFFLNIQQQLRKL